MFSIFENLDLQTSTHAIMKKNESLYKHIHILTEKIFFLKQ